jgi:hypothetical protein
VLKHVLVAVIFNSCVLAPAQASKKQLDNDNNAQAIVMQTTKPVKLKSVEGTTASTVEKDSLLVLPTDLIRDCILPLCDAEDALSLELSCKQTKKACDQSHLWKVVKTKLNSSELSAFKEVAIKDLESHFLRFKNFHAELLSLSQSKNTNSLKKFQMLDDTKKTELLEFVFVLSQRLSFSLEASLTLINNFAGELNINFGSPYFFSFLVKSDSIESIMDVMRSIQDLGEQRDQICADLCQIKNMKMRQELLLKVGALGDEAASFCEVAKDFIQDGMHEHTKSFIFDIMDAMLQEEDRENLSTNLFLKFKKFYEDIIEFDKRRPSYFFEVLKCSFFQEVITRAFVLAQDFNFVSSPMTSGHYILTLFVIQEREQVISLAERLITKEMTNQHVVDILHYLNFIGESRGAVVDSVKGTATNNTTPDEFANMLRTHLK